MNDAKMPEAVIIYQSRKGKTEHLANELGIFLQSCNTNIRIISVFDCDPKEINENTLLFLGCWTRGRFLMGQRPQQEWADLVERLTNRSFDKIVLFTAYNIATGAMFKNMERHIIKKPGQGVLFVKSRTGKLSDNDKNSLLNYCYSVKS